MHHLDQPGKALGEMFFAVRLQSEGWLDGPRLQEVKEQSKIDGSLTNREMVVTQTVVVMHMYFFEETPKGLYPSDEGSFGESVLVSDVQAKAAMV
jgi:hypothetical protein